MGHRLKSPKEQKMPITATIEVPAGQTDAKSLQVKLRIMNQAGGRIEVLNPDMGIPASAMKWPWSNETYQTSLLISFGYLSMSVTDETGKEPPQEGIQTGAKPVLRPNREREPGDSFEVAIPIGNFYQLTSRKAYWMTLTYGDQNLKVSARTRVIVP